MKISVVVPAFNESKNLPVIVERLEITLIDYEKEIIIVNDGSKDNSIEVIKQLQKQYPDLHYITFSRNFGHQNALKAGIDASGGECIISIDADLQHPVELIPTMIKKWKEGYTLVTTIRRDKKNISLQKKLTSKIFYWLINLLSEVKIHDGAADFRLIDKKAAAYIQHSIERDIFFRGYIQWLGFKSFILEYEVGERQWGETKYTPKKMINLAINGITSFSIKPLRIATFFGFIISSISFIYGLYVLYVAIFTDTAVAGWASVLLSVLFIGGIQLVFLGVFGEYLGKIFIQTKARPDYIIDEMDDRLSK